MPPRPTSNLGWLSAHAAKTPPRRLLDAGKIKPDLPIGVGEEFEVFLL